MPRTPFPIISSNFPWCMINITHIYRITINAVIAKDVITDINEKRDINVTATSTLQYDSMFPSFLTLTPRPSAMLTPRTLLE